MSPDQTTPPEPRFEACSFETLKRNVEEFIYRDIMAKRDTLIAAFIAETGLRPSECEQVFENGQSVFRVRKRPELERRKSILDILAQAEAVISEPNPAIIDTIWAGPGLTLLELIQGAKSEIEAALALRAKAVKETKGKK